VVVLVEVQAEDLVEAVLVLLLVKQVERGQQGKDRMVAILLLKRPLLCAQEQVVAVQALQGKMPLLVELLAMEAMELAAPLQGLL
jgi:hypothetical protein